MEGNKKAFTLAEVLITLTRKDMHFYNSQYVGDGSGTIYYIAFTSKTVEEIVADHSFLN